MVAIPTVMLPSSFALTYSTTSGGTYTAVKDVKSFDLGNIEADEIDVTSFSSPGNFREFANGLKQAQDGNFVIHFLIGDTQHNALRNAVGGAAVWFKATYTGADGAIELINFSALIKGVSKPANIGELLEATVTFKMTGQPTYTDTAAP